MRKPNLFIVGAPKCATTSLHNYLDSHAAIFMSKDKEPHYFCKDLHKQSDNYHKKKRYYPYRTDKQYLSLFDDVKTEKIIGESSVFYLYSKVAAKEIYLFNPKAKIIIMVRNPVEFIYSWYWHIRYDDVEDLSFKNALELEKERKHNRNLPKKITVVAPFVFYYMELAQFSDQIKKYLDVFPRKNIKIVLFDEFKKDTSGIFKDILGFLGVNIDFRLKPEIYNPAKKTRFKLFRKLAIHPFIWSVPKKILPTQMYKQINKWVYRLTTEYKKRPYMDEKLKNDLMNRFRPEVLRLSKIIEKDLIKLWGYDNN